MAKSKNNASRRPDDVTVTSRPPPMKLRSPSARRPSTKFNTPPPKPTADCVPAESPELSSPPSSPVVRQQQHLFVVPDVRPTERSKAILHAMAEEGQSRRMKKLDAIKTPPLPKKTNLVPVPVATPTRKKKNDCPAVPVRQTPKRKTKKVPDEALPEPEPPADVQLKRKTATTAIENPPPVKRKTTTATDQGNRPEKQRKTTGTSSQPHQLNNLPAPANSSPTRRPNPLLPRRSPRSLAKSAGLPNPPPPEPTAPEIAPPPATIIPVPPSNPPRPPPTTISQPIPVVATEPTAPEFEPMHAFYNSSSDDVDGAEDNLANIPSIRCKSEGYVETGDETGEKRKVRGVVNGSTLASYKQTHNKGLAIKVEFLPSGTGPAVEAVGSLIIHEIGSAVKDKVPMIASSFRKLVEQDRRIVFDHLRPNFVIEKEDDQLWNYIFKKACERYRDWKSNCKAFYKEHGPDVTPREFLDRRDQWDWLKRHFEEPTNKERGNKMSDVRNDPNRLNHRAGKRPFHARAAALAAKGDKAHFIATFSQVYSGDPKGAALAEKMQSMVRQALADQNGEESEHSILDDHEPLPVHTQIDIISQVVGQTRGTYVTGTGKAFKRPPLPRGGPRNSHLKEQMEKQKDEFQELKAAFEERIRVLEDLVVRGGSANLASQNASEGATSYGPDARN